MKNLTPIHEIYSNAPKLFSNQISNFSLKELAESDRESLINDFQNKNYLPLNAISIDDEQQPVFNRQSGTLTVFVQQLGSNTLSLMNRVALRGTKHSALLNVRDIKVNTSKGALTAQCVASQVELKQKKIDIASYLQNLTEEIELHNKTGSLREQLDEVINNRITELEREKKSRDDLEGGTGFKIVDGD